MASSLERASVPDLVFGRLREAIVSGRYRPGEQLPTQRGLAAELGVNLTSVREALKRLEQLRLVEIRHGDATRVLDWRRSGGLEALMRHTGLDPALAADLFEARRVLLVESASLAAARRSGAQARELERLARAVAGAGEVRAALLADWEFVATLVEAAGNLVFQLVMNSVRELCLQRADAFAGLVSRRELLAPLYEGVAAAVRDQEGERAAAAIEELAQAQARWALA